MLTSMPCACSAMAKYQPAVTVPSLAVLVSMSTVAILTEECTEGMADIHLYMAISVGY